ncbi:NAD-dependent epimerase/dehydratase family protein [Streptomyces sp. A7024]|uniref:NAD-dependent epimerase/dehydratase family protein n=1 Tax=Streptomyces coryli TaxID=1128680 RepID=A0A6G4UBA4_9ACTN|nr:NAD-dependent epimerase/dehydratase family protein [Streptomyces coryli]NGN69423.1 NAD-dependent epimerase/dehydratase family protein [Streptomyces coryli]
MRVLLLGANGFLGRYVADRLLADPAVQLTTLGRGDDADVRFDLASGSPGALTRFLDAVHPGVVINAAGATRGSARDLIRHNTVAVATICEAMRRSSLSARLVQLGCAAEYGPSQPGSSTAEDALPRPGGPYGVSKLSATELVLTSGLDAIVLRVFSPIGPGTPAGSPLGRLAEALRRAMQAGDGELKLSGLGAQRDFVDVRDVARAVHAASLSAAQGAVNIGSGRAVRLRDAAATLARVAGYGGQLHELDGGLGRGSIPQPSSPVGAALGNDSAASMSAAAAYPYPDGCGSWQQADVRTARDRLGWRPRIGIEESLADIWMEAACRI